jgi:hypothetical protein
VCERHLNFLAMASLLFEGFGFGDIARGIASRFVDRTKDLALWCLRAAAVFHRTRTAVADACQAAKGGAVANPAGCR